MNRFERKKNIKLAVLITAELKRLLTKSEFDKVRVKIAGGYDVNNLEVRTHR